jgi:DNA glycosylase AlkZ-like
MPNSVAPFSLVDVDRVLAFRLARSGLAGPPAGGLAQAAACPAADFSRDAALQALGARLPGLTRERYEQSVDAGELVVAHIVRGAIHALAPQDLALYGRALIARDDKELGAQLGRQMQRLAEEKGFAHTDALDEVAAATTDALADRPLDRVELHEALRSRVNPDLMPWCRGCQSYHVAPMLWRYATVQAGVRLDSRRRYTPATPDATPDPTEAVRRFLRFYGPSTPGEFADWAGLAKPHAKRLWDAVELTEVQRRAWLLPEDVAALDSPPQAAGLRLIPPGDPYLQKPNRPLLAPTDELRKRLFRPVGSPGAILLDGRLAGLWRPKLKGATLELSVEPLAKLPRDALEHEAERIAHLRGANEATLTTRAADAG